MWLIAQIAAVALLVLALRGRRWAYAGFVALSLLYFPLQVRFHFRPQACELAPTLHLAIFSLQNTAHIIIFAGFFALSWIQFRRAGGAGLAWAGLATLLMGALLEIAQGVTGYGHCRLRDLVPDFAGSLLAGLPILWYSYRARRGQQRPSSARSVAA